MKQMYTCLVLLAMAVASCSTTKNSQGSQSGGTYSGSGPTYNNNGEYYTTADDQYVHMLASNPARWSYFDDYNYDYYGAFGPSCFSTFGSFMYGYTPWTMGFGYWSPLTYWNSYYTWNTFYNPYYTGVVVVNPKATGGAYQTGYTKITTYAPTSYSNNLQNLTHSGTTPKFPASRSLSLPSTYNQTIRGAYYNRTNLGSGGYQYHGIGSPSYGNPGSIHMATMSTSGGGFHSFGGGGGHR